MCILRCMMRHGVKSTTHSVCVYVRVCRDTTTTTTTTIRNVQNTEHNPTNAHTHAHTHGYATRSHTYFMWGKCFFFFSRALYVNIARIERHVHGNCLCVGAIERVAWNITRTCARRHANRAGTHPSQQTIQRTLILPCSCVR